MAPKHASLSTERSRSSTDSTRKSTDYAGSDRRKSSSTNPVRFSVGLMGPTRASTGGPTKPALRKATAAGQDDGRRPRPSTPSADLVHVLVQPPTDQPITQPSVTETAPQRLGSPTNSTVNSTNETVNSMVEISALLHNEENSMVRPELVPNSQELLKSENIQRKAPKHRTKRANFPSFSNAMARLKDSFTQRKDPEIAVSLRYLISCLPTSPCTQCECPMLLADIYRRLIEHCDAAGLRLQQLRFLTAYGSLTMVAGYPVAAILALSKAIEIAGFSSEAVRSDGGALGTARNKKEEFDEVIAKINVLLAEARLQIGDLSEALRFVKKETSRMPWKRSKASAHAHALNSDIYAMEGDWAKAEREALKALKSGSRPRRRWPQPQQLADEPSTWALAGALDASRFSGHPQQCERLERFLLPLLNPPPPPPIAPEVMLIGDSASQSSSPQLIGPDRSRRSVSKTTVADPRRARAAARLLYSLFVSRLDRGDIAGASEPGEAALTAAEAMGATLARAAILPQLALAKMLLLDMSRSVALISYFWKTLEREDPSDHTRRSSTNFAHLARDMRSSGSPKTPLSASIEEDSVVLPTAEYHCIRLDATLFAGVPLRDAHREAEHYIQLFLGAKSANSAAQRVAARLSLLNARKGRWTECALLATLASPSLTILEVDANTGLAEIGNSAMHLLEAALFGYAIAGHENGNPMQKVFDKIPQWINALKHFVEGAPMLVPRFLLLSAYFKMLRGKSDKAMEKMEKALSTADQQGNRLAREYISLHKTIWREEVAGLTAAQWLYAVEQNGAKTSEDMRPSVSTVPLASIPSDESVEAAAAAGSKSTAPPPPSPTDPDSPLPVQPELRPDFVAYEAKTCRRPGSSSLPQSSLDEDGACFKDDPGIRRWEARRRSTAPTPDKDVPSLPTEELSSPEDFRVIFFCLPVPVERSR